MASWQNLEKILATVYAEADAGRLVEQVRALAAERGLGATDGGGSGFERLGQRDLCLVCYADSITSPRRAPLAALGEFIDRYHLDQVLPNLHLLPFFPWDTDRGFSVIDYLRVHPDYGDWDDCLALAERVRLMYDFVANHASVDNPLVQKALLAEHLPADDPAWSEVAAYRGFVIVFAADDAPGEDALRALARPRAFPVLTPYRVVAADGGYRALLGAPAAGERVIGSGLVWTTFSRARRADGSEDTRQVDLNYRNPAVFLEVIRILLFYVGMKGELIRLDAIGYLWKRLGASSLHEPECHRLIEAMGEVLRLLTPQVITVAEVNEPQSRAFTYIGSDTHREADMAYQFSHFALAIHAVLTGQARYYRDWLATIGEYGGRQFTTVLGSHDGLAMKQARELLPEAEFETLCRLLIDEHGGLPNMAMLPGGTRVVYEVCATPWCLVNGEQSRDFERELARYLAVTALGLCLKGMPAIYLQGLVGAGNYRPDAGLDENRTVNRERFDLDRLGARLDDPATREARVFAAITRLCRIRAAEPAFDPHGGFELLPIEHPACVGLRLLAPRAADRIVVLINVGDEPAAHGQAVAGLADLVGEGAAPATLAPYQVCWLRAGAAS